MTPEFLGLLGTSAIRWQQWYQHSCRRHAQIPNRYKSASVMVSFAKARALLFDCYPPHLFIFISLLFTILFDCTTNKLPRVLSRLFIYLKFTCNCNCTDSVDIHFQFKAFLLKHSINNATYVLSGEQLVFMFWNSTLITRWRPKSLTMDVGRPSLMINGQYCLQYHFRAWH